jgi:small GTP-binding protein
MKQDQFYKLIFTGPPGAGKTTAISVLSDVKVITTEAKMTNPNPNQPNKKTLTVGLDYGSIKLSNEEKIHLYGTPGQERFDFMWDIVSEGGIGLILLIDNAQTDPLEDLRFFVKSKTFGKIMHKVPFVIGITRVDINPSLKLDDYHQELETLGINPPIFEVDARSKADVSLLVQALLYSLDHNLKIEN